MTQRTSSTDDVVSTHSGWCPDCDLPSVVVDLQDGDADWAECVECGTGWVHRDEISEHAEVARPEQSRAA